MILRRWLFYFKCSFALVKAHGVMELFHYRKQAITFTTCSLLTQICPFFFLTRDHGHMFTLSCISQSYWLNTVQSHIFLWWWDPLKYIQLHVRAVTVALNRASQWLHCWWVKLFILKERISCMWKTWEYSPAQLCKLPWVACILSVFLFLTCNISSPKSSLRAIISFSGMWMWHVVKLIPSSVCSTSPWKINIPDMTSSLLVTAPAITGCRREAASRRCQTHLDSSCFLDVGFRWNILFI